MMNVLDVLNRKRRRKKSIIHNGSFCIDSMSSWSPEAYSEPQIISDFLKHGTEIVEKKIKSMKLDEFNASFLDDYIDNIIDVGLANVENQRIIHLRILNDIRVGQSSYLMQYKKDLEKLEIELRELREEMC